MLLAQTIVFYCTICWFCFLERAKVMSLYIFSGSRLQTRHSDQSTVRFSFTLQTERRWQEVLERSSGCYSLQGLYTVQVLHKSTNPLYLQRERERAIISEQSVVILIPGRQYVITGEIVWLCCAYKEYQKSSPALSVAVPALLLIGLCEFALGTDVIWQVGPEPFGLLEFLFDVNHLPWAKTVSRIILHF